ncbi:hypothetical protein [Mycobacterium antarcticum]|uniref:hypothetical protein n=1 Tax=unclassified Mycolicibacterium TaxID=2636767 RepID=UPI0024E05A51|nr:MULTISPECIES: hypothetical protein [unclassified Mycolicibacterium]
MTQYSFSRKVRLKHALRRYFNLVAGWLRTPVRRPVATIVSGGASAEKAQNIEARLQFLFEHLESKLDIRTVRRASWMTYVRDTAVVAADSSAVQFLALKHLEWVADLDYDTNLADGWSLMELGVAISPRSAARQRSALAGQRFRDHVRKLETDEARPAYIFGTGPSLHLALDRSFADGTTIVCNTIVRDPELWRHLSPAFLAAGDAIYHFGNNPHARAFRADALERLQESEGRTLFVYPSQFDVIVRSEFHAVEPLLVPIPWGEHSNIAVDLNEQFLLPDVENVLANLLLPLGCSLSRDVRMWGFDGRGPSDSGFWANSDRHAYPELMQSIRDAHPAFFANKTPRGNETKYVNHVHGDLLDERLAEAERRGFRFQMLHPSWTPTLQKRYRQEPLDQG